MALCPNVAWTAEQRRGCRVGICLLAGVLGGTSLAAAQETIFNVPDADILEKGKTYLETDFLWRPQSPRFADFALRGVRGLGGHVEAGLNLTGFKTPGRSIPEAQPTVKWQPWSDGTWSLTAGAVGRFFVRGARDGTPTGLAYAHAAAELATGTRVTAGGYWAAAGYAADDARKGALAGVEQAVGGDLKLAADWFSGNDSLGYLTPGLIWKPGACTIYLAYSFKNADSKGNAVVTQLGFEF